MLNLNSTTFLRAIALGCLAWNLAMPLYAQNSKVIEFHYGLRYPWVISASETSPPNINGGGTLTHKLEHQRGQFGAELGFKKRPNPDARINFSYGISFGFNRILFEQTSYLTNQLGMGIDTGTARLIYFDLYVPLSVGIRLSPKLYFEPELRGIVTLFNGSQYNYTFIFFPSTYTRGNLEDIEINKSSLGLGANLSYRFNSRMVLYGSFQYNLRRLHEQPAYRPAQIALGLRQAVRTKNAPRRPLQQG